MRSWLVYGLHLILAEIYLNEFLRSHSCSHLTSSHDSVLVLSNTKSKEVGWYL